LGENLVNLLHCSENRSRHVAEQCMVSNLSRKISQNEKETTIKFFGLIILRAQIFICEMLSEPHLRMDGLTFSDFTYFPPRREIKSFVQENVSFGSFG